MTKLPATVLSIALCGLSCHGSDLHATDPEIPDLTDDGFKTGWVGKTVANRFRNIRTAMTAGAPGSLDDQTYVDIVAYILQFNGPAKRGASIFKMMDVSRHK